MMYPVLMKIIKFYFCFFMRLTAVNGLKVDIGIVNISVLLKKKLLMFNFYKFQRLFLLDYKEIM